MAYGFRPAPTRPLAMLTSCPAYAPTPLRTCPALAAEAGIASLMIKHEAGRMGLGSFKALGGAFAVAQILAEEGSVSPADLLQPDAKAFAASRTFITASAGNHGLSVAAGAKVFGAHAVIVLSATVPEAFAERIRAHGAGVERIAGGYEDSVAHAAAEADRNGWIHLADGSWPGYTEAPGLVMEGYTVIAEECRAHFAETETWPSHIFLQAGVGGLAAAFAAHVRVSWPVQPVIIVVEPEAAPCLRASIEAGALTRADGPVSNMGRLDCKEASLLAFEGLRSDADGFTTISDEEATDAAVRLAAEHMPTTPSGASGLAALLHRSDLRSDFGLTEDSRCLVIVSEGPER